MSASVRVPVSILCILAAYFGNYFVTSMIYNWGNSFVAPGKRAEFSSVKEMVSLLGGFVLSIAFGFISGCYQKADNSDGWFLFSAMAILIFAICDFICLLLIQPPANKSAAKWSQRRFPPYPRKQELCPCGTIVLHVEICHVFYDRLHGNV